MRRIRRGGDRDRSIRTHDPRFTKSPFCHGLLGAEFEEAVGDTVARLSGNSQAFQRVQSEVRRAVLRRFPYAIYFRTDGDDIIVLAVHGRQDPARWQSRG
jgi:hypothetical protein